MAPGTLSTGSAHGSLLGTIGVDDVKYTTKENSVNIGKVTLRWQPSALMRGKFIITALNANNLSVDDTKKDTTLIKETSFKVKGEVGLLNTFPVTLNIDLKTPLTDQTPLAANITLSGDRNKLQLQANTQLPVKAQLHATVTDPLRFKHFVADANWENANIVLSELETIKSKQGSFRLAGTLDSYQIDLSSDLSGEKIPDTNITLKAAGDHSTLHINTFDLNTLEGSLRGIARADWSQGLSWDAKLTAEHINPGSMWHDIPGDISFDLHTSGKQENTLSTLTNISNLTGSLRTFRLDGNATVATIDRHLKNIDFTIDMDDAHIEGAGKVTHNWDVNWSMDIPDLYVFSPYGSGSLTSTGKISGELDTPIIDINANAKGFSLDNINIKSLSLNSTIDAHPNGKSHLTLSGHDITIFATQVNKINASLDGKTDQHTLAIDIDSKALTLEAKLSGQYLASAWQGTVNTFSFTPMNQATWTLSHPSSMHVSEDTFTLSPLTLKANDETITLRGLYEKKGTFDLLADLTQFNLNTLTPLLPENMEMDGLLTAKFNAQKEADHTPLIATLKATLLPGSIAYPVLDQIRTATYHSGQIEGSLDASGFKANANIQPDNNPPLSFTLSLPDFQPEKGLTPTQVLSANLAFSFEQLDLLTGFFPDLIGKAAGIFNADINASGTFESPNIGGTIMLTNGLVNLPPYGITVKNINAAIKGNKLNEMNVTGSMESGEGKLNLSGNVILSLDKPTAKIKVIGDKFEIMNTKEYHVIISPDMLLDYTLEKLKFSGDLNIIKANLEPQDYSSTISLPNNVEYEGIKKKESQLTTEGDVAITLVNPAHLNIMGLDADITGKIDLRVDPYKTPIADGTLSVTKGSYIAYGQKLTIDKAKLFYQNTPITNPGILIRATRKVTSYSSEQSSFTGEQLSPTSIEKIKVGVNAQGTADNLRMDLFSDPAGLSQADILSYLILGKPQNRVGPAQATLLLQAITSNESGSNSNHIVEEMQQSFGLDELDIKDTASINPDSNQPEEHTSLVIGKKFSKRFSAEYSAGLLTPVNVLRLIYQLTSSISAQLSTSPIENGADVFYTIERE